MTTQETLPKTAIIVQVFSEFYLIVKAKRFPQTSNSKSLWHILIWRHFSHILNLILGLHKKSYHLKEYFIYFNASISSLQGQQSKLPTYQESLMAPPACGGSTGGPDGFIMRDFWTALCTCFWTCLPWETLPIKPQQSSASFKCSNPFN